MTITVVLDTHKLEELINKAPELADKAVRQTAFYVGALAAMNSPYKTGANRASIVVHTSQGNTGKQGPVPIPSGGALTAYVGPTMEYSAFLEFGTSRMAARPYLIPAIGQAPGYFADELIKAYK